MMLDYTHGTALHRLNPACKILVLVLYFIWAMLFTALAWTVAALIVALVGATAARSLGQVRKSLPLVIPVTIMCLLLWSLLAEGKTPISHWGHFTVYREALLYAAAMAIRLNAMLIAGITFISITSIEELRLGLLQLRLPFSIAFAISLAFRLVPNFAAALEKVILAQKSRGLALDAGGPVTRMRNYAPLIIPVILVSLRNTDQLAAALEARGFGNETKRTSFLNHPWRWVDTCCCVIGVLVIAGTVVLMRMK